MSVTFTALTQDGFAVASSPCLCTQMAESFSAFVCGERTDWEVLRPEANPDCVTCKGSGVEESRISLRPSVNFANGNAVIVLDALGVAYDDSYLFGECEIAVMKRGIIRARNITMPEVLRERVEEGNYISQGYTRDQLMRAISQIEKVVSLGEKRGATVISWG